MPNSTPLASAAVSLGLLCLPGFGLAQGETRVASPDSRVVFTLGRRAGGLYYGVSFGGRRVIDESRLSMTVDGVDLAQAEIGRVERYHVKETYPTRGNHAVAVNEANGARIALRHLSGAVLTLEVRASDDGAAFRFIIPGGASPRVPDEATVFTVPAGSTVWRHEPRGHYEGSYTRTEAEQLEPGTWAPPPVTFRLPGRAGYASITEAALTAYPGMMLQAEAGRKLALRLGHAHPPSYPFTLRYGDAEAKRLSQPAAITGTITTPWRAVIVGSDLNALVNSDMVENLSPPPDAKLFPRGVKTAWIRPGRAVWEYLDGRKNTLEESREFTRLAGELGFEHHVIEGFWRRWTDDELRSLVAYGKERGVGIWLWRHSRELRTPEARKEFFEKCRAMGVAGVKLDFFDHEAKEVIDHYDVLLRETAEHQLMVNFHGSNKPAGQSRTWPNELTREAVRGMESRFAERARHNTTLPFTRLLAGSADYTPVHFGERRGDTTAAHQIASAAVLTSALQTYGASPRTLLAHPALEMIKSIPATWDETRVLPPSEIGEAAVLARRSGDTWFLAVLNGPEPRKMAVPLSFLGRRAYDALVVGDAKADPATSVQVEKSKARRADTVSLDLQAGGGFIARYVSD